MIWPPWSPGPDTPPSAYHLCVRVCVRVCAGHGGGHGQDASLKPAREGGGGARCYLGGRRGPGEGSLLLFDHTFFVNGQGEKRTGSLRRGEGLL